MKFFFSEKFNNNNVKHMFFTNDNKSLNVAFGRADNEEIVINNRNIISNYLNAKADKVFFTNQQHSNIVQVVNSKSNFSYTNMPVCDALVTNEKNIVIGVYTADCIPLILFDLYNNVIGVAHCGWKGLHLDIIKNTVLKMESLGAEKDNTVAVIGPCIRKDSYKVSADFLNNFKEYDDCFEENNNNYFADLPKIAIYQLNKIGIKSIDDMLIDTYKNDRLFFSYRRSTECNQKLEGAQASVVSIE